MIVVVRVLNKLIAQFNKHNSNPIFITDYSWVNWYLVIPKITYGENFIEVVHTRAKTGEGMRIFLFDIWWKNSPLLDKRKKITVFFLNPKKNADFGAASLSYFKLLVANWRNISISIPLSAHTLFREREPLFKIDLSHHSTLWIFCECYNIPHVLIMRHLFLMGTIERKREKNCEK